MKTWKKILLSASIFGLSLASFVPDASAHYTGYPHRHYRPVYYRTYPAHHHRYYYNDNYYYGRRYHHRHHHRRDRWDY